MPHTEALSAGGPLWFGRGPGKKTPDAALFRTELQSGHPHGKLTCPECVRTCAKPDALLIGRYRHEDEGDTVLMLAQPELADCHGVMAV